MRKKSHISLGKYLVEASDIRELRKHRKAFLVGCILPDCKPSFITKRHEIQETYELVKDQIRMLSEDYNIMRFNQIFYWRKSGEILHYIADFFTYPHNEIYEGTLRDHCKYENYLKHYMRYYLHSGRVLGHQGMPEQFSSVEDIYEYVEREHARYLAGNHGLGNDTSYIARVCLRVMAGMYQLCCQRMEQEYRVLALAA